MCGLSGIVDREGTEELGAILQRMTRCQLHRGPDYGGSFLDDGVGLAHRRLAILDPSEDGRQPMHTPDGRHVLIYNGEVYNYREMRRELKGDGVSFGSRTDAEVVLYALARWGESALERFEGMFALAFHDTGSGRMLLARDRMGIKPLYHYRDASGALLFASEVRALLASGRVPRRLNRAVLPDFLSQQTVPAPDTLVEDVHILPPGHLARFDGEDFAVQPYTGLSNDIGTHGLGEDYAGRSRLRDVIKAAVERRLVSDVPLGAFLSGGVDSTLIVGLMSRLSDRRPSTFTLAVDEHDSDDVRYARQVADRFETDHREVRVSEDDLLRQVSDALSSQDHPTGDGLNTYLVARAAREAGLTVALSGVGGDELFGGYTSSFRWMERTGQWRPIWKRVPDVVRRAAGNAVYAVRPTGTTAAFRDLISTRGSPAEVYPVLRGVFYSQDIAGLLSGVPKTPELTRRRLASLLGDETDRSALESATVAELGLYMQEVLLRDADQMGMAHSLEIRVPFLDGEAVTVALALGDRARRPGEPPKKFLTDTFDDIIPRQVARRPKEGFTLPMERWMRSELRESCGGAIRSLADHPAFVGKKVRDVWDSFLDGDPRYTWSRPWLLVALGAWVERHDLA